MTAVEAANADALRQTARGRQANADTAPAVTDQTGSGSSFASMLTTARQSSAWLDGVLDRRVDQIAASYRRHQRVQQTLTSENSGALAAAIRPTRSGANRVETLQSAQADNATRTRQSSEDRPARAQADGGDQSERSSRFSRTEGGESRRAEPAVEAGQQQLRRADSAGDQAAQVPRESEAAGSGFKAVQAGGSGTAAGATGSQTANAEGMGVLAGQASPTQATPGIPAQPVTGQVAATTGAQAVQAVTTPAGGNAQQQGTTLGRPAMSGNAVGETAASGKGGGSSVDFQSTLQQATRARQEPVSPRAMEAAAAKRENAEVLKPSSAESVQQLARIVRSNVNARHASLMLRLDPPELGQVRVDVRMHDQIVNVRIEAETRQGMEALQTRLTELKHALEQQGVQIDRLEVEHRPPVMPQPGQQENGQGHHGDGRGGQGTFNASAGQGGHPQDARQSASSEGGQGERGIEPTGSVPEIITSGSERLAETGVDLLV